MHSASSLFRPTNLATPSEYINKVKELRTVAEKNTDKQIKLGKKANINKYHLIKKASEEMQDEWCSIADNGKGRKWTVAIAVPGSLLNNATSQALRTYIAGAVFIII